MSGMSGMRGILIYLILVILSLPANSLDEKYIYYKDGSVKSKALYSGSYREGNQIDYYRTGEVKRISIYINGKKEGYRTYFRKNGDIYKKLLYKNDILVKPKPKLELFAEKFCHNRYGDMYATHPKFRNCMSSVSLVFLHQKEDYLEKTIESIIRFESRNTAK